MKHPEMILGQMVMESTRFGMDSVCRPLENTDLEVLLQQAASQLHARITEYQPEELEEDDHSIPADPEVRNFSFTAVDGKLYFRENSRMNPVKVSVTAEKSARLKELNILLNMDQKDKTLLYDAPEEDTMNVDRQRNVER